MNGLKQRKLEKSIRRAFSLLLAALMTSSSVLASAPRPIINIGNIGGGLNVLDYEEMVDGTKAREKELRALYGEDWQEVGALRPGDSYIGEEYMYVCHDETRVRWTRVKSIDDLEGESWNGERLLLVTSTDGKKLVLGNDYAATSSTADGTYYENARLTISRYNDTWPELDKDSGEYVDVYRYPELQEYVANSSGKYPYPDSFQTKGTMNAPYLKYVGKDEDNGDNPMFRIILSKDNGEKSANGLGLCDDGNALLIESAKNSDKVTFKMETKNGSTFLNMFFNVSWDDDVYFVWNDTYEFINSYTAPKQGTYIAYLGEKYTANRIDVYSLDPEAAQDPDNLENVYGGSIEIYRWCGVYSEWFNPRYENPRSLAEQFEPGGRMMLVWDDKYFISGDDFRVKDDGNGMALYVNEEKGDGAVVGNLAEHPEIKPEHLDFFNSKDRYFYTADGLGTPYLYYQGRHDSSFYDYTPMFTIQLAGADDKPSNKWLCDADNKLGICEEQPGQNFTSDAEVKVSMWDWEQESYKKLGGIGVREENRVCFIFGNGMSPTLETNSDNDCRDPNAVKLVFEDSPARYDTGLKVDGNVLYGDDDGNDWNFHEFKLLIGKKVTVPAVRQDYIVGEDQFMHVSEYGAMLQDVTITVKEGGVLSVEDWFMNNGRIIVNGGTLIVQQDGVLLPQMDINPAISGSLSLINGGELIVMENGRAAVKGIRAESGSSILNNGILLAETIALKESTLENRPGKTAFVGYDFRRTSKFQNGSIDEITAKLVTQLNEGVPCITMDAKSISENNGIIKYSASRNMNEVGKGRYDYVRGKVS